MKLQFVVKKLEGTYEAALVVDGRFARSGSGQSPLALFTKLAGVFLGSQEEGTETVIDVNILTPADIEKAIAEGQKNG